MRTDFIDYPTGWALQRAIGISVPPHLTDRCSAVQTNGAMLCDCGAIALEWRRLGGADNWRRYVPTEFQECADPLMADHAYVSVAEEYGLPSDKCVYCAFSRERHPS